LANRRIQPHAPNSFFGWDDAVDAKFPELIATQDAVILGRRSYNEWAQFWPSSQIEPFATFINGVEKYVATSTPLDQEWANSTVVDGGLVEFVRDLKHQPGRDVGVHGSISVAQALLAAADRRPRTTTPRRLATDSARIDPKRDLTDWLPDRRLSPYP
jgi:dihydrofolate reductase